MPEVAEMAEEEKAKFTSSHGHTKIWKKKKNTQTAMKTKAEMNRLMCTKFPQLCQHKQIDQ